MTVNEQLDVRMVASRAVQFTVDIPNGNCDPFCGRHVIVTGGSPAVTTGVSYITGKALPLTDVMVRGAGHAITGPGDEGLVGPPHAVTVTMTTTANEQRSKRLFKGEV